MSHFAVCSWVEVVPHEVSYKDDYESEDEANARHAVPFLAEVYNVL